MQTFHLPSSSKLDIASLTQLFSNTSECYKFFWFQAVLHSLNGKDGSCGDALTFDSLVNEMIVNAWFMVNEYHLNLGPKDKLEELVIHLKNISGLKSNDKREKILKLVQSTEDKQVRDFKKTLILNVPYRLQAPFMADMKGKKWERSPMKLIENINEHDGLIYKFDAYDGLDTRIHIDDAWLYYLEEHNQILDDWLKYNLISYLERRNPGVPGIINKLTPPEARDLGRITKFWKSVGNYMDIYEIYGSERLEANDISIDHFIPWSYVSHDEFWNLSPTTRSINSSKSNNLPDWNKFFNAFCELHYSAYVLKNEHAEVKKAFEACQDKHINDHNVQLLWSREEQTPAQFMGVMEEIVQPVYQSAARAGFGVWNGMGE